MSIEQTQHFHQVRRILKAVAPEYRLIADTNLPPGQTILDVSPNVKTLAIADSTEIMSAVSILLFQVGHLLLVNEPQFAILFGKNLHEWTDTPENLISELADLGCNADHFASKWAVQILESYWPVKREQAVAMIETLRWSRDEWVDYFKR